MLVRVLWIVNKVVRVGWCNAVEGKVALAVYGAMFQSVNVAPAVYGGWRG